MKRHNRAVRRYLRETRGWLPCSGKLKREIMVRVENVLDEYLAEHLNADFSELSRRFGEPKQIASSYVDDMDTEKLLCDLRVRRRIVGIVTGTALILITLWAGTVTYAIIHNEKIAHGYGVYGEVEDIERTEYNEGN